jgi:hypothetical protein
LLVKTGIFSGLMNGFGFMCMIIIFGLLLYLGLIFVEKGLINVDDLIPAIMICFFTGNFVGNNLSFMPDVA